MKMLLPDLFYVTREAPDHGEEDTVTVDMVDGEEDMEAMEDTGVRTTTKNETDLS